MYRLPENFNPGAIPRPHDSRDVPFSALIPRSASVDWTHGYDVLTALDYNMPVKDQGSSSSCVGQASAYLAQLQEFVENKIHVELSAHDIYSRGYIPPEGGMYGYKGLSLVTQRGIAQDILVPSNENGRAPSEAFMRIQNNSDAVTKNALIRKAKGYAHVDLSNLDELAYAIKQNHGAVFGVLGDNEGWQTGYPVPPKTQTPWGHFLVLTGFKMVAGKKYFYGPNSWSEDWGVDGFYYIDEHYIADGWAFNAMTLLDLPNDWQKLVNMKRVIKLADSNDQYIVEGGRKIKIPDLETLVYYRDILKIITDAPAEVVTRAEFDNLMDSESLSIGVMRAAKNAYPFLKDAFEPNVG